MHSNIMKAGIVLFIVTLAAGLCLGIVHEVTLAPIAAQQAKTQAKALMEILPEAQSFQTLQSLSLDGTDIDEVFAGLRQGKVVGYVFLLTSKEGFSDDIRLLAAIRQDGKLAGVHILSQNETPGLGANAAKESFWRQFTGKTGPFTVVKTPPGADNDIQAISGATITSRAITNAVNEAIELYDKQLKGADQ